MNQLQAEFEIMRAAGLNDNEIARLATVKRRVGTGQCDDLTIEYKRMMFFKLLCDSGRMHDN